MSKRGVVSSVCALYFLLCPVSAPAQLQQTGVAIDQAAAQVSISPLQMLAVGRKIWKNECKGTISGLTSWNVGEGFPSLGIGHFIWYRQGGQDRFQESFPGLVAFLRERGAAVPAWLAETPHCPWNSREEFLAARDTVRMRELRQMLAATISLQTEYIAQRLAAALPTMIAGLPADEQKVITARFKAMYRSGEGIYALMDYINFKGEGVKETERYNGQGWGMLQVLQGMSDATQPADVVKAFSVSAGKVLERRVENAPEARRAQEAKWLPGWLKRTQSYTEPLGK